MSSDPTVPPPMPEPGPPLPAPGPPPQQGVPPYAEPAPPGGGAVAPAKEPRSFPPPSAVHFTRTAAAWWALVVGVLTLIVLLVFITQNLDPITVKFLGWEMRPPTGVALLVAAICGSLITVMTGGLRMLQLRRAAKKNLHTATRGPSPRR